MADLPTRAELFRRFRNGALAVPGTLISPTEIDREGSDLNLLAAAAAIMGEEIVNRMALCLAGVFEDTASGDRLDRVIFDRKGLPRKGSAPFVGEVQLTRPTAAAGAGVVEGALPGEGPPGPTRIRSNRGITYLITEDAIFGAADLGPVTVPIQAETSGIDQGVDADQAWSFVDVPFDSTILISNPDPDGETAGGSDEEADEDYRARASRFFETLRRGTLPAIEFGLLSTSGIASATVLEVLESGTGLPACSGEAFILDELGRANEELAARGLLSLLEYRALGIPIRVTAGTIDFIPIEFSGTGFDSTIVNDTSVSRANVRLRIVSALGNQQPGQELLRSTILAAAKSEPGFIVEDSNLIEPSLRLVPSTKDITFRTRPELITFSE